MAYDIPPNVSLMVLDGNTPGVSLAAIGTLADRGCAACKAVVVESETVLVDSRGRYWHQRCAGATLAQHTRRDEDRASARYLWHFDRLPPGVIL